MTPAQRNHLRLLLGWVRCEIGQTPEEYLATVAEVAPALSEISDDAKVRIVKHYDHAKSIPKYVRNAIKQLTPLVRQDGDTISGKFSEQLAISANHDAEIPA